MSRSNMKKADTLFKTYSPQHLRDAIDIEMKKNSDPAAAARIAITRLKKNPHYYMEEYGLIDTEFNVMQKARLHKYIRREPDGKGGFRYIYKEDVKRDINAFIQLSTKDDYNNYTQQYIDKAKIFQKDDIGDTILRDMEKYQNFWYKDINKDLRNDSVDKQTQSMIDNINKFIDEFKIQDNLKLYRGISIDEELESGDLFIHKSFASFTSSKDEARQHGFDGILICNFKKNDKIAPMIFMRKGEIKANVSEQEFIAKNNLKFKIISKHKENNRIIYNVELSNEK